MIARTASMWRREKGLEDNLSLSTTELSKYWDTANILRKNLDAAEYKHIVLGLVFLKYVSDAFEDRREELTKAFSDPRSDRHKPDAKRLKAALDERDYYKEVNVFWVPETSRWSVIEENAKQPNLATLIDNALYEIEKENPKLEGIVERRYADARLPVADLGAVVDLISSISFGNDRRAASDVLGQVYEYFLGKFASAEGKLGGQFYTTPSIVKTLVEVLQPTSGRVYDPCCGSGGMFVQSERFVEAHGGKLGNIAIYGQESNPTTRRLCAMNLAIRGIDFDLGKTDGDTFLNDQHKDKKFDYILMNPPFGTNASYPKEQLLNDVRWKQYGVPRERPANYAWMSHAVHHLSPKGRAGIVMPRGTLTSSQGGDDSIRKAFLDDDVIECIIDLPGQLFFNTQIPSCLWFFNRDKFKWKNKRQNQILFIDARKLGTAISRTQIEFSEDEITKISDTFNNWCNGKYEDVDGFCKSVTRDEIAKNGDSLSPGRYIGTEEVESENDEDFGTRMHFLTKELESYFTVSEELIKRIKLNLKVINRDN
jgi:type I restriction enzyme M protein